MLYTRIYTKERICRYLLATAFWHLLLSIRDKRRWTVKLGATLLVLAGVTFVWVTLALHLYGFNMVF
ncbi:hypothetical protein ATE69_11305 [Sphingopyxis sp. H071]|uniref:hypothetical protein n=1 Tax=Allorhizobium sp. TaxID=633478 RepID=UPI00058CCD49|nr:hypothetical protein ATE61_08750 [Sphingopyxis sp. H057]KTE51490.1 hypothetical protein ATE64_13170 [Sphingopyxis sp. H073]KTE54009.1 hypothetical protein ATE69_11305 [Sphingopyxis sp. H071]KTE60289.1 hypothetical protein ATE66_08715 [Sphingopyxis sp. H107]KTE65632.1 hypothetical protein ATE65_08830 [Sphingopyxis sp. H100]KTE73237.1 hypothetical protein ATE60_06825 [Sphingopyxis sp. H081]KTE78956.1 hypothetical protein ATE59_03955 [Sphingopyxis sp. A083]KTE81209.1 hypothetical protein ATE